MHFFTVVLLPNTILGTEIEVELKRRLAPFDENLRVPAYQVKCDCINSKARRDAFDVAERTAPKTIDAYREGYWNLPNDERLKWEEFTADWQAIKTEAERNHPMYQKPDPECDECHGTGVAMSTYNPKSEWDWWRVGGRWDGCLIDNPRESDNGFNWGDQHETFGNNMAVVSNLPNGYVQCYAVLTPDGDWIDRDVREVSEDNSRGKYVGQVPDDEWDAKLKEIFAKHKDCLAVGCDMHI